MKNYILVHGAWGAAWEFNKVKKMLLADGNNVIALDLPGHGENKVSIEKVTMEAYVQAVVDVVNDFDNKVILVGHSLAGAIISQVAELIPDKIDRLIYVAAILLSDGESALSVMQNDEGGELLANIIFSDDQSFATLAENIVRNILLNDVNDEVLLSEIVPEFLMKQSTEPFMASAQLSQDMFGSVKKYYVKASIDKVLSPSLQDKMISNWKVERVFTLGSGHFPLTSMPKNLVDVIRKASI
jgi:pimeloyl-ACP methyl ester carboxylesterase